MFRTSDDDASISDGKSYRNNIQIYKLEKLDSCKAKVDEQQLRCLPIGCTLRGTEKKFIHFIYLAKIKLQSFLAHLSRRLRRSL